MVKPLSVLPYQALWLICAAVLGSIISTYLVLSDPSYKPLPMEYTDTREFWLPPNAQLLGLSEPPKIDANKVGLEELKFLTLESVDIYQLKDERWPTFRYVAKTSHTPTEFYTAEVQYSGKKSIESLENYTLSSDKIVLRIDRQALIVILAIPIGLFALTALCLYGYDADKGRL